MARTGMAMVENGFGVDFGLVPGMWVRHPSQPDWGPGQVQSVIGNRVTVNFENCGKVLIDSAVIQLEPAGEM